MIATVIFTILLLVVSFAILQIGKTYYKGITEATTQGTARSIIDTIAQDIQYSGDSINIPTDTQISSGSFAICIGGNRYNVNTDRQVVDGTPNTLAHQANHALTVDQPASCDTSTADVSVGRELLVPFTRLVALDVCAPGVVNTICTDPGPATPAGSDLYYIRIRVVYGDDDVLDPARTECINGSGSQFCGTSELTTTVQKRVK